jgi:hypothetical protein
MQTDNPVPERSQTSFRGNNHGNCREAMIAHLIISTCAMSVSKRNGRALVFAAIDSGARTCEEEHQK